MVQGWCLKFCLLKNDILSKCQPRLQGSFIVQFFHVWILNFIQLELVTYRSSHYRFMSFDGNWPIGFIAANGWSLPFISQNKLNKTMAERRAVIKNADMSEDMQQDAVDCASQALEKYNIEKDIAAFIKKEFDKKYNPTWHCIVGRNFGSYVTHETKHFIYFYLGQVAILLFKSG